MINYDVIYSSITKDLSIKSDKQLTIAQLFDKIGEEYGEDVRAKFYSNKMLVKIATIDVPDNKLEYGDLIPGDEDEIILIAAEEKGGNAILKIISGDKEEAVQRIFCIDRSRIESTEINLQGYVEDDEKQNDVSNKNVINVTMTVGKIQKAESSTLTIITHTGERHIFEDILKIKIFSKESPNGEFIPGNINSLI